MARLLVIDDEPRIVALLSRVLRAQGFAVDAAGDGVSGLERILEGEHDLVILDLVLPGKDGVTVLREAAAGRPDMRVIVMSALSDVHAKVRCLDLGAVDYVTKPFALAELLARIRLRLRPPALEDRSTIRAGDLELDIAGREARVGGRRVPLSTRELLLLRHLMERADEVASREELLERVWGFGFDPGSNVVDVYVRRLRNKLGCSTIETVRGVGYTLGAAHALAS
jgi:DNA-binding response OmpR family regulator